MVDLTGKTILLTGASRGIGFETAVQLGAAGAHVVAHYGSHLAGAQEATGAIAEDHKLLLRANLTSPAPRPHCGSRQSPGGASSTFSSATPR